MVIPFLSSNKHLSSIKFYHKITFLSSSYQQQITGNSEELGFHAIFFIPKHNKSEGHLAGSVNIILMGISNSLQGAYLGLSTTTILILKRDKILKY